MSINPIILLGINTYDDWLRSGSTRVWSSDRSIVSMSETQAMQIYPCLCYINFYVHTFTHDLIPCPLCARFRRIHWVVRPSLMQQAAAAAGKQSATSDKKHYHRLVQFIMSIWLTISNHHQPTNQPPPAPSGRGSSLLLVCELFAPPPTIITQAIMHSYSHTPSSAIHYTL